MARVLIVAHAPLASALHTVAQHIYPDCAATLVVLDVHEGESAEAVETRVRQSLGDGETLILADVAGATPCNAALRAADGKHSRVVTGVNVSMLWRALCYAHEPLDCLVTRAVEGGARGVTQLASAHPQNQQSNRLGPNDQEPHHDQ